MSRGLPTTQPARSAGVKARSVVLHSLAAAFMFVSPLALFVPAAFISARIKNGRRGLAGAILGAAAIFLLASLGGPSSGPSPITMGNAGRLVFEIGLPSFVVTELMSRAVPFGVVVLAALATAAMGFFINEVTLRSLMSYSPYEALVQNVRTTSASTIEIYRSAGFPPDMLESMRRASEIVAASYVPLIMAAVTVLMFILSLVMLPRLPVGRASGAGFHFRALAFPDTLLFVFVLAGLSPLASGALRTAGLNVLGLLVLLYFLQGLAIARSVMTRPGVKLPGMLIAFSVLVFLTIYLIAPVLFFLVGLFDSFFDFRHFNRKDDSHESHID